jgi:hypothetical protein
MAVALGYERRPCMAWTCAALTTIESQVRDLLRKVMYILLGEGLSPP